MKKILVSLLLLVAMMLNIFAMTSCLPGNNGGNEEEEGKINITFYHTMGQNLKDVLDIYVEKFEKMYPDINVIHEAIGGYDDVRDDIATKLTTGEQPNLAYCYPDHVALYNVAKAVVTLDQFIDDPEIGFTAEQKADFIQGYYAEGMAFGDGKMYSLPLSKSTEVLYYNKTFFEDNNLTVPTTWDEMEEVCKKIIEITSDPNNKKYYNPEVIPLGYDSEANWFITMCEQLGTDYTSATGDEKFLFNNDENKAFVKRFTDWYTKGYVTTQEIYGSYTSGLFKEMDSTKPKSYMSIGSSAGATKQRPDKDASTGEYPFEVGITSIPQADKNNPKVISQGPSVCIFNGHPEEEIRASWLFVKFLTTSIGFQAEFSQASGYVPVIKSVASDPDYAKFLDGANGKAGVAALSAKVCLEQEKAYYTSPAFNGSSDARDEVGALLQKCFVGSVDEKTLQPKSEAEIIAVINKSFKEAYDQCKYKAG